jgi:hypothetical protein
MTDETVVAETIEKVEGTECLKPSPNASEFSSSILSLHSEFIQPIEIEDEDDHD